MEGEKYCWERKLVLCVDVQFKLWCLVPSNFRNRKRNKLFSMKFQSNLNKSHRNANPILVLDKSHRNAFTILVKICKIHNFFDAIFVLIPLYSSSLVQCPLLTFYPRMCLFFSHQFLKLIIPKH